jgi:hypothetical protein
MRRFATAVLRIRSRDLIPMLTLVSHLCITLGLPLPLSSRNSKDSSIPFPCENRPCGCLSSEQCWAGDCCCFTLEEKLAWADANGIEPPPDVRPKVEARRAQRAAAKKKCCCSERESPPESSVATPSACCDHHEPAASVDCCSKSPSSTEKTGDDCQLAAAKNKSNCCETKKPADNHSTTHWLVGIFAQKCRNEGPASQFQFEPALSPDLCSFSLPEPEPVDNVAFPLKQIYSISLRPPIPPPRSCEIVL